MAPEQITSRDIELISVGVLAGPTIAVGYLQFGGIGALLVSFVWIQSAVLGAALIAGVAYPVAFEALGSELLYVG